VGFDVIFGTGVDLPDKLEGNSGEGNQIKTIKKFKKCPLIWNSESGLRE
jgi:hypothetical protein